MLLRPDTGERHPVASVGLVKDGGLFVAPVAVGDYEWTYGTLGPSLDADHVTTSERPKLHYHRSGIASVTLSGAEIPRRSIRLKPLGDVDRAQVFSITLSRPWELARTTEDRPGDIYSVVPPTTRSAAFSLSIMSPDLAGAASIDQMAPIGLVAGDGSRWFVDLAWYGQEALIVGQSRFSEHDQAGPPLPAICVAALPWEPGERDPEIEMLGLWTSHLYNPNVLYEEEIDRPARSWLQAP